MPFIWDDSEWLLVGDQEPYDKSRFVVARKLSVKPNTDPDHTTPIEEFSADHIRGHIEKFGEIESIEILAEKEPQAHVTFFSDRSAYLMLLQYEYNKEKKLNQPFEVEPVDSWEQPKGNKDPQSEDDMKVDEQKPEMFMLNEDCLRHLFKFLDLDSLVNMANVCKMFNGLLHQHCFPRIQKYKLNVNTYPKFTLAKARRTLLCIGQHLTDLSYRAEYKVNKEHKGTLLSSKCLRIITQLVGQNIRRADFCCDFKDNQVSMMAPIFERLESLEIKNFNRSSAKDIDFLALCPNLIEFILNMNMSMIACCKPWPTLRSLSVWNNDHLKSTTLISFIKQNPQLTCLEFDMSKENRALILAITKYLTSLEKLTIDKSVREGSFDYDLSGLINLPSLCKIHINFLDNNDMLHIIDHLTTFKNLRQIWLDSSLIDQELDLEQSFINLAKELPFLEELRLYQIPLDEVILINVIRFARRLSVLHLQYCDIDFSDELIAKLVDALKSYRKESDGALRLILDREELKKLDSIKNKEIGRYLQLEKD